MKKTTLFQQQIEYSYFIKIEMKVHKNQAQKKKNNGNIHHTQNRLYLLIHEYLSVLLYFTDYIFTWQKNKLQIRAFICWI